MEIIDSLNQLNTFSLASLEIGKHFYWEIGNFRLHGQVFLTSWLVMEGTPWGGWRACDPGSFTA